MQALNEQGDYHTVLFMYVFVAQSVSAAFDDVKVKTEEVNAARFVPKKLAMGHGIEVWKIQETAYGVTRYGKE